MHEDFLTCAGGAVKALGRGRVGGRVITFSTHRDPDRVRDYFDLDSQFWLNDGDRKPILFRHGCDPTIKQRRFGSVSLTLAADGVWAEGTIEGTDQQAQKLRDLVDAGGYGWSTGSVAHLVQKTERGSAFHVDLWPVAECSLGPRDSICEPRNIAALKELIVTEDFDSLAVPLTHQQQLEQRVFHARAKFLALQVGLRLD